MGRKHQVYDIQGVSHLDFYDLCESSHMIVRVTDWITIVIY